MHTAAHGPSRTYQRETVTVAAGRSKIHTCRTDDTGLHLPLSVRRLLLCVLPNTPLWDQVRCLRRRGRGQVCRAACVPAGPVPLAARGLAAVLARAGPAGTEGHQQVLTAYGALPLMPQCRRSGLAPGVTASPWGCSRRLADRSSRADIIKSCFASLHGDFPATTATRAGLG